MKDRWDVNAFQAAFTRRLNEWIARDKPAGLTAEINYQILKAANKAFEETHEQS